VLEVFLAAAVLRLRALAAFFPAATRFGDFRVVALRAVVRFRVVAALRAVVRFRVVAALRAAGFLEATLRVREVEAFLAATVLRLRALAAFFPAATRFGDFRVVALRAVVRFRVVVAALRPATVLRLRALAAFFPAATRFGDFRVVAALRAVVRFRVVAALRAAGFLEATLRLRVVAFALAAVAAFRAAVDLRVVAGRVIASSIGPPIPVGMVSDRGVGRSQAGVSGRHDGSGVLGASRVLVSSTSCVCSVLSDTGSSASFQGIPSWGRSFVVRSSDDDMTTSSARGSHRVPYPTVLGKMHRSPGRSASMEASGAVSCLRVRRGPGPVG
jgi:hypothetical protein